MAEKAKNATIGARRSDNNLCSSYISSTPISGNAMGAPMMTGKTLPLKNSLQTFEANPNKHATMIHYGSSMNNGILNSATSKYGATKIHVGSVSAHDG